MQSLASHPKIALVQHRIERDIISNVEIERKFLVASLPENLEKYPHTDIFQGYIKITDPNEWKRIADTYFPNIVWIGKMDGGCLRIRRKGDKYILGTKRKVDKSSRLERLEAENSSITEAQFTKFKDRAGDLCLSKIRYLIPYNGLTIELDIFKGKLSGHKTYEVEFGSREEADAFKPPKEWFGKDVTEDRRYSNKSLAKEQKVPQSE